MGSSLYKLDINGTEVPFIFEESRELPIVSLKIVFQNSGAIEDKNLSGLANISASLLNEGSLKSGSEKFALQLEESAINFSAGVGKETFVLNLDSIKESFPKGVDLLIELLKSPNFSEDTFNRIKEKIRGHILQKNSNFDYLAKVQLDGSVWRDTPFQNPTIGTEKSLEKIELESVKDFISQHLVLRRAIPVIGGDLTQKEAEDILGKILSELPVGESEELGRWKLSEKREDVISFKDTKQAYIYFESPLNITFNHSERYKSKVMFFILGSSGFGSRLMEEVRVKNGLAYSVRASEKVEKSRSTMTGYLQTKNENLKRAKDVVKSVITNFVESGVTEEELESAKKFILGSEPLRNETLSQRINRSFGEYYRGVPMGDSERELQKIRELTLKDLNSFIKEHSEILELTFSVVTVE
jgi:zinc protease